MTRRVISTYSDKLEIEFFERRFKRKPKIWSIEEIHDLWIRTCERADKRRAELSKITKKIIDEIPKEGGLNWRSDSHVVYFEQSGKLRTYNISWHSDWQSYGTSIGDVEMKTRDEKLTFILAKQRAFELGEEYHKAYRLCSSKQYRVLGIMWEMIENQLRKHFKDQLPPQAFIIAISGKKYHVVTDDQHRHAYYSKFHFKGEVEDKVIEIR